PENPDPETPVTPENPDPETPVTPENPDPEKPVNLENTNYKTLSIQNNMANNKSQTNKTLPKTGETKSSGVFVGIIVLLTSIFAGTKLNLKRKKG
ncbi:LPXTG cell wall anchor domain-containing protein, partial [Enterococcus faecalis]|nr:LPXTG cell wall anchor domain-containing protein [Enterococcus faecalis]EHP1197843.1 LPXTG cell wall anchor domain-containing protein [Enterococcus faecalis]